MDPAESDWDDSDLPPCSCPILECLPTTSGSGASVEHHPVHTFKYLKDHLPLNWDVCSVSDGRLFYLNHSQESTQWVPPAECWTCRYGLPYSWEIAIDTTGKAYYINHLDEDTTYADPRIEAYVQPPEPREVVLQRDTQLGFGFVAGSEKPVVVRFVTEGGPSSDKLLPGDEIWLVNDEDVRDAAKDHVVQLVRNCSDEVRLTVCQKRMLDSNIKSALLSAAKRARLKNNPPRVRFAEGVLIGTPPDTPRGTESCVALMPNVLRVFLENGQTKSFKYDQTTTVQDVMENLQEKLGLRCIEHFSLTLEHPQGPRSNKLSLLRPEETVAKIAARPGSQHFRCLFRAIFVPNDPMDLLKNDPVAFEYLYQQCVNDVVQGRYAFEMRYEACLRLAALQMQQCSLDNHCCTNSARVSLKFVEKEYGLNTFLPSILLENVKLKEIRKHLRYYLKRDVSQPASLSGTPNQHSPLPFEHSSNALHPSLPLSLAIKVKYVHMLGHLPSFGGRTFYVTFKETNTDMLMQVGPKTGITVRNTGRNIEPTLSLFYDLIAHVTICAETEVLKLLSIKLKNDQSQSLDFLVDKDDVDDLVLLMQGYYFLLTKERLNVHWEEEFNEPPVPPYLGLHSVRVSNWNYMDNNSFAMDEHKEHLVDLSRGPPKYKEMVKQIPIRKYSNDTSLEDATLESSALLSSVISPMDSSITTVVDVQLHSEYAERGGAGDVALNSKRRNSEEEDLDTFENIPNIKQSSAMAANRKTSEGDGFVRRTFLKARDSLIIRQRSGSRSRDLAVERIRSKSGERLPEPDATVASAAGLHSTADLSSVSESDTDTLSTPSESPIHRPNKRNRPVQISVNGKNPSFGLQSPDNLPCSLLSDAELQQIITTCGLEGQQLEDLLLLFPDNFCTDSEIIDLTMLPPPKTPEEPSKSFVVTEPVKPPTPFADQDPQQQQQQSVAVGMSPTPKDKLHFASKGGSAISAAKHLMRRHGEGVGHHNVSKKDQKASTSMSAEFYKWLNQPSGIVENALPNAPIDVSQFPSIENREEFEQFLQRHIVPPPPPVVAKRRVSFDGTNVAESDNSALPDMVKCSTGPLQRRRPSSSSAPDPKESQERVVAISRQNYACKSPPHDDGAKAITTSSSTVVETHVTTHVTKDKLLKGVKQLATKGLRRASLQPTTSAPSGVSGDTYRPPSGAIAGEVRRISLRDYSGLEESELLTSKPEVTSVDLRRFMGVENSDASKLGHQTFGASKQHVEMESIDEEVGDKKSGTYHPPSPNRSSAIRILSSTIDEYVNRVDQPPPELTYGTPESRYPNYHTVSYSTPESRYPNYLYHRRRTSGVTSASTDADILTPVNGDDTLLSLTMMTSSSSPRSPSNAASLTNGALPSDRSQDATDEDFERAKQRVGRLVDRLKETLEQFPTKSPRRALPLSGQKARYKNDLLNESQQFAAAGKLLVRSVTEPRGKLLPCLEHGVDKAKCVHEAAVNLLNASDGLFQAQTLGAKIREVLVAFERTLDAAKNARGKPLGDAEMKRMMRQSTTLAATLTQLIRTVRET